MQIFRLFALIFLCLIGTSLNKAWAQSEADKVLFLLDQFYYYPQNKKLVKLTARVQWEQLDVATGSGRFLRNPDFKFVWQREGNQESRKFELIGNPSQYSSTRKFELKNQIKNYGELIVPLTLRQKFSGYLGETEKVIGDKLRLFYKSDSLAENVESYSLLVDRKNLKIEKIRFTQRHSPRKVNGTFRYEKLGGKWTIAESHSSFKMGGLDYKEISQYRYKKIEDVWLVHRIDQTLKQGNQIFQSHRFKIFDVRLSHSAE